MIKTFKDLIVWQKAMDLVTGIYKETKRFPGDELFGLSSQIRRCAVSIPSNIAEGYGRSSREEYKRFLQIAISSLFELQTQIEIALNLQYFSENIYTMLFSKSREIEAMLVTLIRRLKN
jgi:four helix bundle protein